MKVTVEMVRYLSGIAAAAYLHSEEDPAQYRRTLDAEATRRALVEAQEALAGGDGIGATVKASEAFVRLALFHRGAL